MAVVPESMWSRKSGDEILRDIEAMRDAVANRPSIVVMCGRCRRPVDRVSCQENHATCEYVYVAECHGEKETSKISRMQVAQGFKIVEAVAFKRWELTDRKCELVDRDIV